jgi:hypothetical protein
MTDEANTTQPGNPPAAPAADTTGAAESPFASLTTVDAMRADAGFTRALLNPGAPGHAAATQAWLTANAAGAPATPAPAAQPSQPAATPPDAFDPFEGAKLTDRLKADPAFLKALNNPMNPGHKAALARWDEANKQDAIAAGAKGDGRDFDSQATASHNNVPSDPSGYKENTLLARGLELDTELVTLGKQIAHGLGLSQSEFETIQTGWDAMASQQLNGAPQMTAEEGFAAAVHKHGEEATRTMIADAKAFINGLPDTLRSQTWELLELSGLNNSAPFVESLALMHQRRQGNAR